MPITKSVGYPGPITGADLSYWSNGLGRDYAVSGPGAWKVTSLTNGLRQASIATGGGSGFAIRDEAGTETVVSFEAQVSGGTRYDLVVARRDWGLKTTTFAVVKGGATREGVFGLRNKTPGTLDDQPIAVVPILQGSDNPGTAIDVRVWQANGHATALDNLVLQYVNNPGSTILIDSVEWHRIVNDDGSTAWRTHTIGSVPLAGVGLALGNGEALSKAVPPGAKQRMFMQAGTIVQATDLSGFATITWPFAFTGGLMVWNVWNGDDSRANDSQCQIAGAPWHIGKLNEGKYRLWGPTAADPYRRGPLPSWPHRANWFAMGWM